MGPEKKQKAEDILASDLPYNWEKLSRPEQQLANNITTIIYSSGNAILPEETKSRIWENVNSGASLSQRKQVFPIWLKLAASFFLITSITLWFFAAPQSDRLKALALDISKGNPSSETILILGNGETIALKEGISVAYHEGEINQKDSSLTIARPSINQDREALNRIKVPYGRRARLTLDDGTKVWLNSGSQLVYPVSFARKSREVFLVGEAYFDVAHSKQAPFYVHTEATKVKVLGTEFNISSYVDDNNNSTTLVNGSIELTVLNSGWLKNVRQKLRPGDQASYSRRGKTLDVKKVDTESYASWKDGYMQLDHMPFNSILKCLSRYYNIQISKDANVSGTDTFSGRLDLKANVEEVMKVLCAGTNYWYDEKERRLIIR